MEPDGRFESLKGRDNQALTLLLFESINAFHSVPRLRQKLAKIVFADFEAHVPHALERDVSYLVSGLNEVLGMVLDPHEYPDLPRELGEYLRHCDSNGLAIHHFLSRSAKPWDDIRSKYQESSRVQLARELCKQFPGLPAETADRHSGYLLSRELARLVPPFSFHEEPEARSVVVMRAQPDLPWNLCAEPLDATVHTSDSLSRTRLEAGLPDAEAMVCWCSAAFAVLAKNGVCSEERAGPTRPHFDEPGSKPPPNVSSRVLFGSGRQPVQVQPASLRHDGGYFLRALCLGSCGVPLRLSGAQRIRRRGNAPRNGPVSSRSLVTSVQSPAPCLC